MAGAGYKLFNTGDVLTAAQVNTYLQEQVVMVFANAAARTTALSGVLAEGMVTYLKDTDALEIYSGAAWVGYGSGDITGITTGATSGLTGGVTSGTADLKLNTTAKGGLLVGTGSGTVSELSVGSNNTVLTADSTTATGLKWATAASGGLTLLSTTAITATASLDLTSISGSYTNLYVIIEDAYENSGSAQSLTFNNNTSAYSSTRIQAANSNTVLVATGQSSAAFCGPLRYVAGSGSGSSTIFIPNYASSNMPKHFTAVSSSGNGATWTVGQWDNKSAITSVKITWGGTPTAQGNVYVYGEK